MLAAERPVSSRKSINLVALTESELVRRGKKKDRPKLVRRAMPMGFSLGRGQHGAASEYARNHLPPVGVADLVPEAEGDSGILSGLPAGQDGVSDFIGSHVPVRLQFAELPQRFPNLHGRFRGPKAGPNRVKRHLGCLQGAAGLPAGPFKGESGYFRFHGQALRQLRGERTEKFRLCPNVGFFFPYYNNCSYALYGKFSL